MKKLYTALVMMLTFCLGLSAQSWTTVGTGFLNSGDIATNLQLLSYQDTVFVAYADMDEVKLKKRSGNNWVTVVNQNTENNFFKLIYGTDNKPFLVTVSRGQEDVGTTGFYANIHEYENGTLTLLETRLMVFIADNDVSNLQVSNFDFIVRADGSMAGIIRFPSTARSVYNVKIGNNPWHAENVFFEAFGGTTGNAIEQSKMTFFEEGVFIISKLFNQSSGTAHMIFHDNASSIPTSTLVNEVAFSFGVGSGAVNPFSITARADTVYTTIRNAAQNTDLRAFFHDDTAPNPIGNSLLATYDNSGYNVIFTSDNNYMSYTEDFAVGYVSDLSGDFTLANGQIIGGMEFTLGETVVAPQVFNVNPTNGDIHVAYIFGPPMSNSMVRKFGCAPVAISYNTGDNELSITSNFSNGATFEWTLCGETEILGTASTFTPEEDGDYQVTVIDGSCEVTSNCVSVEIDEEEDDLSVNDANKNELTLFPNPATSTISVKNAVENTNVKIYNAQGQLVLTHVLTNANDSIAISALNKGVYTVLLLNNDHAVRSKFVKQ